MAGAGCGALDRPLSAPYCPTWFMLVTSVFQGNIATPTFHSTVAEPVLDINVNTLHWHVAVFDYLGIAACRMRIVKTKQTWYLCQVHLRMKSLGTRPFAAMYAEPVLKLTVFDVVYALLRYNLGKQMLVEETLE